MILSWRDRRAVDAWLHTSSNTSSGRANNTADTLFSSAAAARRHYWFKMVAERTAAELSRRKTQWRFAVLPLTSMLRARYQLLLRQPQDWVTAATAVAVTRANRLSSRQPQKSTRNIRNRDQVTSFSLRLHARRNWLLIAQERLVKRSLIMSRIQKFLARQLSNSLGKTNIEQKLEEFFQTGALNVINGVQ